MYSILLLILHSIQADWVLVTKDLYEIDVVSLEPQVDTWMSPAESDIQVCTVPYAQAMYYNNAGTDWIKDFSQLSNYQGYYKIQIMMDIYVFALTTVKIYFDSATIPIFTQVISELPSSYCVANDQLIKVNLELPIDVYPSSTQIKINGLTSSGSVKNFFLYVLQCPLNCLNCNKDGCLICKSPYTPQGMNCVCRSPYSFISQSGECLTQCPSGQFPYINNKCQPISSSNIPLFSQMTSATFASSGGTFISDPYFTQSVPSIISVGALSSAGPFRYNEGISYVLTSPVSSGSIVCLQFTIFWLSQATQIDYQIGSKIYVYFDDKIVSTVVGYRSTFVGPTISTMNCVSTDYSSCVMVKSQSIRAVDTFNKIKFIGAFNMTSNSLSWAIRDIQLDQVNYNIPAIPTISSCTGGQKYFENACYTTCPSYTTDMGTTCQDIGSIYQYPLYMIKAFYDYNIYQNPKDILGTDRYTYGFNSNTNAYNLFYYKPINKMIFGGTKDQYTITLNKLPPHYKVKLFIKVLLIDGIQGQDKFVVKIDNNPTQYINFAVVDQLNIAANLQIGSSGNDYKNDNFNVEYNHNAQTMTITIRCQLSSTSVGTCGIYDFFVILARCPKNCNSCISNTICTTPLSYQISNCEYGTYYDLLTLSCLTCPSGCMTCTSSTCIQCYPTFEMFGNACYCKTSGYPSQYDACGKCHTNCLTCISSSSQGCLSCDTSIKKWRNQQECSCIPGYYMAETTYTCLPCDEKCKTCQYSYSQCTSCYDAQNRYFNYKGCDCKSGYFEVSYQADCIKCGDKCETCYLSPNNCRSCYATQYRRLISNQCYCDIGYFDDGTNLCKPCKSTCQTCLTQDYCLSCYNEQYRILSQLGGSCVCMNAHYEITNYDVCPPCHLTCQKCNNSDDISQCTKCPTFREPSNSLSETFQCKCSRGYYESSNYVCADCKVYIDPPPDHYCYSDCGDGIIQWNEDCDDMNDNPRDGCNECKFVNSECLTTICSDCRVDSCVQCIDGFYLANDSHCYPCSEICITCENKSTNCKQCTITADDGSCVNCIVELGFQIDGDKCVNICGDGIKVDGEQCDGNTNDGDGCDSKCQIESGSVCSDSCDPVTFVQMKLSTSELDQLYDGIRHITLSLSEQVQVIGQITNQIQVTIANYTQFTIQYQDQSVMSDNYYTISILITLNLTDAIESPTVEVTLMAPENISNKQGQSLQVANQNIKIKSYQIQSSEVQSATEGLMSFSQYILYVMLGLAIIAFLFGGLNIFWNLLDLLQLLSYIKYFNVQYPYNVDFYFTLFGFAEFDFLKQYVNLEEFISQFVDTPDADPKFQEEGYSTLFLVNAIAVLTVFFTTLATYFLCQFFSYLLKKTAQSIIAYKIEDEEEAGLSFYFLMKITKNLETYLFNITAEFNSGLLRTFMAVAFDLNLAIFLQLKDFNYHNAFFLFSGVVAIFAFAFELYYIVFGFLIMNKPDYYLKLKSTEYMYGSLYEGLKIKKNCFILAFNLLNLIKKMTFMFFLVFLYNVPSFQIAFASLLNLAFATYILYTQPLDDSTEFHKNYICELILWTVELLALLFAFSQQSNAFNTEQELLIGWFIIGLCTLVILIQLMLDVKQHAEFLVSQYTILQKLIEKMRGIFTREAGQEEESFFLRKHMPGHKYKTKEYKKIKKVVTFSVESSSQYS